MNSLQPIKTLESVADGSLCPVQAPSGDNPGLSVPGGGRTIVPPPFINLEWLRQRISLPNSRIRQIHESAEKFLAECPAMGWPRDRKPTQEEALAIFLNGFANPPVFDALLRPGRASPKALFDRFNFRVNQRLVPIVRATKRPLPKQVGDVVSFLCDYEEYELASEFAVILGTFYGHISIALEAVRRKPKLAEATRYLEDLSAYRRDLDAGIERAAMSESENASGAEMTQMMDDVMVPVSANAGDAETASVPALPESAPAPEPVTSVAGTAVDAWRRAMERLIGACGDVPSVETASLLQGIAARAMEAALSYEASLPKFEEAAPFIVRLSKLAASWPGADHLAVSAGAIDAGAMVPADEALGIESLVSVAEGLMGRIRQADIDLQAMWEKRDMSLLVRMQSLQAEKENWRAESEGIVRRTLAVIAALSAAPPTDHPPKPPTGPGNGLHSTAGASAIFGVAPDEAPAVSATSMSVAEPDLEQGIGTGSAAPIVPGALDKPILEMDEGYAAEAADPAGFADADADALMSLADSVVLRRIWRAQVRVVFPFIEQVRSAVTRRFRNELLADGPVVKTFNSGKTVTLTDPEQFEFWDIHNRLKRLVPEQGASFLWLCYRIRNNLAHMDPATVEHLISISRYWEENSHSYLDDCHGWDWPRCGQKLMVLVGPSGAGKSTWAGQNCDIGSVVSSDAIRERLFGSIDAAGDQEPVFDMLRQETIRLLAAGRTAVIDATNLDSRHRIANAMIAPPDMRVEYVIVDRPMDQKVATQGWRASEPWLMAKHAKDFEAALPQILARDGLRHVELRDGGMSGEKRPTNNPE
jgi:predicted kinase